MKRKTRKTGYRRTTKLLLTTAIVLSLALIAALLSLANDRREHEVVSNAGMTLSAELPVKELEYGGEKFRIRSGLDTVLVIGTDDIEGKYGHAPEEGYHFNYDLADFLVLLVIDDSNKTVTPIQLNRDTMAEVPWLSVNGMKGGYQTEQINFAHTYGSGGEDSCENQVDAVTRFLFNAPIEGYLTFTMDAVPIINDAVGGVTVKLTEDIPSLGSEYISGADITLHGKQALSFVRYRDKSKLDSNLARLDRHRLYLNAFVPQAAAAIEKNQQLALDVMEKIDAYLVTDLTGNDIVSIADRLCRYEIADAQTYTGEYQYTQFPEFYADMSSVWDCVKAAYCE